MKNPQAHSETSTNNFSDVLMYFSESFLGIDDEDSVLWDLAKNCISKLGFVDCVVYLLDKDRNILIQKAAYGPKNPKDYEIYEPLSRPLGSGIVGSVALSGKSELIHDTSLDKRYIIDDEFRYSEVCVPIIIDRKVIGVIDCEHPDKNFFSNYHLEILQTISSICAIKIKSVRVHKKYVKEQERNFEMQQQLINVKLQALSTQMNPHFVFNTLNAIQYFIINNERKKAIDYLSTFGRLIRYFLNRLDSDTVSVKEEVLLLEKYLKLQKLRYDNHFDYTICYDKNTTAVIPAFIIQTLFENLIEYSIFNQYDNQKIKIDFIDKQSEVFVIIKYSHDAIQINKKNYTPEYRKQLANWQTQIRLLNSAKNYNIEKNVLFLKEDKKIVGSEITLNLPNLSKC